jgi:hypothetical protein
MLKKDLAKFNYDLPEGSLVSVAAKIYGCGVSDLLSWSEKDDGSVVIIAPTGQKFTYSADEIMRKILEPSGLECGGTGAVIRTEADMMTPIASDSQTPEHGAGSVTKKDEEVVTPMAEQPLAAEQPSAGDAAAEPVSEAPARKKSTRRRSTTSTRKKSEPEK